MRSLLNFLARYNNLIIFILLEGIAVYLLATGNHYHSARVGNTIRGITMGLETRISNVRSYLNLIEVNEKLSVENVALKDQLARMSRPESNLFSLVSDTIFNQKYSFTSAQVVNNSVNRQKNFFTINKGYRQGMKVDMAVTSENGVAGVIVGCSQNHSIAMSLLNIDFKLSARIRANGYFGSLNWDGRDYRYAILNEIPQHVIINMGDTIEATGYSAVFPEGTMVGTISEYEKSGGDFYKIRVLLSTDYKKLHFVEVIGSLKKKEEMELENLFQ